MSVAKVMYSPSSSPLSPRAFQHHSTYMGEPMKSTFSSTVGISPRVGFAVGNSITPMWMDAYRQLSAGLASSPSFLSTSPGFSSLSSISTPSSTSLNVFDPNLTRRQSFEEPLGGLKPFHAPSYTSEDKTPSPASNTVATPEVAISPMSPVAVHVAECTTTTTSDSDSEPSSPTLPACLTQSTAEASTPCDSPAPSTPVTPIPTPTTSRRSSLAKMTPASSIRKRLSWADFSGSNLEQSVSFMRDDEPRRCKAGGYGFGFRTMGGSFQLPRLPTSSLSLTSTTSSTTPSSAASPSSSTPATPVSTSTPTLLFTDSLPDTQDDLNKALMRQNVQLESVMLRAPLIFCTVRVKNISFQKTVHVRVTSDNWATHNDVEASYFPGSSDGRSDRFYATVSVPGYSGISELQFAVRLQCSAGEFWDSNGGRNYHVSLKDSHSHKMTD